MNITKQEAFEKIKQLVERFTEHIEEYKRISYNEHQTRVDYINPFFKALGWDMDNEQGLAEAYREVIHEDKVKIGGATKAPDYAFTLYGQRKFFVDAEKPNPTDKVSVSRIKYITYDQYLDEFDLLWDIFAKENLPKGRFDKYVQSDTSKKGTTTVDDAFLKSIEEWRTYLATSIALRNKSVSVDELNYAVQKTIDRIIFLRICEDRGVEQYGLLKKAAEKGDVYQNLFALFQVANDKYNSGLFDFKEDQITKGLSIDNKVLKTINGNLVSSLKKQILLNNIFGVDIDDQAVEVTKLNLLLKAMEGETTSSITAEINFGKRILPNLSKNIKCGNSLIGPDFYDNQLDLFSEQMKKINAFDWQSGFPEIFKQGGFDAVIGNPPYVRQELLGDFKEYFKTHYKVYHGTADLYAYFFEKGLQIRKEEGLFGIIVANKWMRARYGEPLRAWLINKPAKSGDIDH